MSKVKEFEDMMDEFEAFLDEQSDNDEAKLEQIENERSWNF